MSPPSPPPPLPPPDATERSVEFPDSVSYKEDKHYMIDPIAVTAADDINIMSPLSTVDALAAAYIYQRQRWRPLRVYL